MGLAERIEVAKGALPADRVLANARLVNVVTGEIYVTDIVIHENYVVALGTGYEAEERIDLAGRYVAPGFIDAHVHIESSLATPPEFARAVLPHGVTTVVTDPHEIANVMGLAGIRYMLDQARHLPMSMFVQAPSCVPATSMETSGAALEVDDLLPLTDSKWVLGLAEVMNYPGVIAGDPAVLAKLRAFAPYVVDGHCPELVGKGLNAYVTAGTQSEHECTSVGEALEKLRLGLTIFIREGTTTRNLETLLPLVTAENHGAICFCTDDRVPASLLDDGSIDYMVRRAIELGLDPVMAIRMATINPARYFGLKKLGVVAPGRYADLVVFSELNRPVAEMVFRGGQLVARDGQMLVEREARASGALLRTVHVAPGPLDFTIPAGDSARVHVIGVIPDQVTTRHLVADARMGDGVLLADTERDILKIGVVERHQASGRVGKGFIQGFGLTRGAIAGTVAHDHHNLVVIGVDDASMRQAVEAVVAMDGGLVVVADGQVLARLPLPVAGLMSDAPIETIREGYDALIDAAHSLGCRLADPMMTMSFMGLEVIPALKVTDLGVVDVEAFELVDVRV